MKTIEKPSLVIIAHSVAYSLLSYLFVLLISRLVTSLAANYFNIPTIIHFNKTIFVESRLSWTFDSVKVIFSAGTITGLIVGLICLVIYLKAMAMDGLLKLFFLWGFIHGINLFVGSVVLGAFIYEGMGYVFEWLFLQDTAKMFLLFIGLILMIGTGTLMVKPMLFSANSYYNSNYPAMRTGFIYQQFLIPYFVTTLILFLLRVPLSLYEFLLLITPGLLLLPLLIGLHKFTLFYFDENDRKIELHKVLIGVAISVLLVFRIILGFGIRIG